MNYDFLIDTAERRAEQEKMTCEHSSGRLAQALLRAACCLADHADASDSEILQFAADFCTGMDICHYEYYYFGGQISSLKKVNYFTGRRAEKLKDYLEPKAWMTWSDKGKIYLALQEYAEESQPSEEEYEMFLTWLGTGPINGEHDHFWFPKFFEAPEYFLARAQNEEEKCRETESFCFLPDYITVDDRQDQSDSPLYRNPPERH